MKILHFADLHLGVESYGRTDPATGVSADILAALDRLADYAIANEVDLVLFCGDAYKSREPGQTQQREFARRINRLALAGVPVFLLAGNHDTPAAQGRATSTEIFDALAVKKVYVAGRPGISKIPTRHGVLQVAALPWLRRNALLGKEDNRSLNAEQLKQKTEQLLVDTVASLAGKLDRGLPAILAAHLWVAGARPGSERQVTIGQEHVLMPGDLADPAFDYVALGHIHKHQVIDSTPPIVYAGSLERVDFGEADDEKGFYLVEIEPGTAGKRAVSFAFQPLPARRFVKIDIELKESDLNPVQTIAGRLASEADRTRGAIVKVSVEMPPALRELVRHNDIKALLKDAFFVVYEPRIRQEMRAHIISWTDKAASPAQALKLYFERKETSPERLKELLERGRQLLDDAAVS